jgi:LPXTG-site transpeptidase (sortase) family protein
VAAGGDPSAFARVVSSVPTSTPANITIDGQPVGTVAARGVTPYQRMAGGQHTIAVTGADDNRVALVIASRPGCYNDVVIGRPAGVTAPLQLVNVAECGRHRVPGGRAGLRLLLATPDVGAVTMTTIGMSGPAAALPYRASPRVDTPMGRTQIILASAATGQPLSTMALTLPADTLWTVVYTGQGEIPLAMRIAFDGSQPAASEFPAPGVVTNTGDRRPSRRSVGLGLGVLLAMAAVTMMGARWVAKTRTVAVGRSHGNSRFVVALAVVALIGTACQSRRQADPVTGSAVAPIGATTTTSPAPAAPINGRVPSGQARSVVIAKAAIDAPVARFPAADAPILNRVLPLEVVALLGGDTGSIMTLAGHTTFRPDQGAFSRLGRLEVGDDVDVKTDDGEIVYIVRWTAAFDKGTIPPDTWAPTTEPAVVLLTCTGPRNRQALHTMNLVVYATATTPIPPPPT